MRGKQGFYSSPKLFFGITPADAGKTPRRRRAVRRRWDHPRGCGENLRRRYGLAAFVGSPPRMRGKLAFARTQASQDGITPADAGKTIVRGGEIPTLQDHPRGCGENSCCTCARSRFAGSPPRMRGKHGFGDVWVRIPRITPADAGKTAV